METYIFNNNYTEQSIRQMETTITFLKCQKLFVDKKWKAYLGDFSFINYIDFSDFLKLNGRKGILFFNIIDGYQLKKYKRIDNLSLIFRPRGTVPEESYYKNKKIIKKVVLDFIEKMVIKNTDYFIFLNNEQKKHFNFKYPKYKNRLRNFSILPNVKIAKKVLIESTNLGSGIKIVYSGGFSKWQNIELVFSVVSDVILNSNINCEFTVLTFEGNFEKARELAKSYHIADKIILKYVPPNKLDDELLQYDIGVIVRDDSIINLTASPFKIMDYISNGLGVILTENIGRQVHAILNKEHFFELGYKEGKLLYNEKDLFSFVSKMIDSEEKTKITTNYFNYLSSITNINLEDSIKKRL